MTISDNVTMLTNETISDNFTLATNVTISNNATMKVSISCVSENVHVVGEEGTCGQEGNWS